MIPLDNAPYGARSAVKAAKVIARRTGMYATYNAMHKSVLIHHRPTPDFGPLRLDAFHPDGTSKHWDDLMIDDAVLFVRMCRVSKEQKDEWAGKLDARKEYEAKVRREKHMDDVRSSAQDHADFLDKKRRGTNKVTIA